MTRVEPLFGFTVRLLFVGVMVSLFVLMARGESDRTVRRTFFFAALRSRPAEDRKQTGDLEIGVCYRVSTGSPTAHLTKSIARVSRLLLFYGPDRESNDVRSSSGDSFRLDVID